MNFPIDPKKVLIYRSDRSKADAVFAPNDRVGNTLSTIFCSYSNMSVLQLPNSSGSAMFSRDTFNLSTGDIFPNVKS